MPRKAVPETVAAVDLGSNSFHLIVARINGGTLTVLDRMKETVRLAGGLDDQNKIGFEVGQRALVCLSRFGQRLRDLPQGAVRAVGTNTLRRARNAQAFLAEARRALGHRIEVIGGREEARLIYLGVAHSLADSGTQRLVVDIGGGSTELIIGRQFEPQVMESVHMGCVGIMADYFRDGRISEPAWRRAVIAARLELRPIARDFRQVGWGAAVGSSGTLLTTARILRDMGWAAEGITLEALYKLRDAMLSAGSVKKLSLTGLSRERAEVFPGGIAILIAIFEGLKLERMAVSEGALREGLLYDLIGRIRHEDVRDRTIASLSTRFQIDAPHASNVEATAAWFFNQVAEPWQLDENHAELLSWAARLHEIGLCIAHFGYHKHGAYLIEHADMPGFSNEDKMKLAALVRAHRRRFSNQLFAGLAEDRDTLVRLAILLRISVLLNRSRDKSDISIGDVTAHRAGLDITVVEGGLDAHPLTQADLEVESDYLRPAGFRLRLL
jgi:exopolyphosphatase / guanosine-5'-triphosphate,3'-diphosphate pyrophosphatase